MEPEPVVIRVLWKVTVVSSEHTLAHPKIICDKEEQP